MKQNVRKEDPGQGLADFIYNVWWVEHQILAFIGTLS
jgi:hypothetical protein